jgi:cyclophilin family peptidyl-prolyl cis-trans isomerase
MKNILAFFFGLLILSCTNSGQKEDDKTTEKPQQQEKTIKTGWEDVIPAVVNLESFDGTRILENGQGVVVAKDIIATRYSMVNRADNVVISPVNSNEKFKCSQYVAIDRINNIILLKAEGLNRNPVELYTGTVPDGAKTIYLTLSPGKTIQLFTGKLFNRITVQGSKLYRISNRIRKANYGAPVFVSTKKAIGLAFTDVVNYETQSLVIPSSYIVRLLEEKNSGTQTLESLRSGADEQTAAENRKIKGLLLETDMGNITIRLFNETPEYRDNFIKLVKENYYDSLLIHRVIANFGIQSGAADTRYAEEGDMIGWKGPGYTLPSHIVPGLFHKRGMIGSPRKPDTHNQRRRSDGSQFYIVSGRRYFDKELDELEEQNNYTFSAEQRQYYKTTGGAPHLDGSYTVFGEVLSGMDVVDKITAVETDDDWRPLKDIRLKKVTILK